MEHCDVTASTCRKLSSVANCPRGRRSLADTATSSYQKWKDKRDVLTLSTLHSGKIANSGKKNRRGDEIMKPDCILDYNAHMCGVDRLDQMLSYYSPLRKTLKWYRIVVLQALDMAVSNEFVLYKQAGGNQPQIWFRTQVFACLPRMTGWAICRTQSTCSSQSV